MSAPRMLRIEWDELDLELLASEYGLTDEDARDGYIESYFDEARNCFDQVAIEENEVVQFEEFCARVNALKNLAAWAGLGNSRRPKVAVVKDPTKLAELSAVLVRHNEMRDIEEWQIEIREDTFLGAEPIQFASRLTAQWVALKSDVAVELQYPSTRKWGVDMTELRSAYVEVMADSLEEAERKAMSGYHRGNSQFMRVEVDSAEPVEA